MPEIERIVWVRMVPRWHGRLKPESGEQLWNLMIDFGIGVSTTASYEVKRIDNDYFSEELG
jgi:restriction system protein